MKKKKELTDIYTEEVLVDEKGKFKGFFQTASAAEIVHDEVNCPSHYVGNIECIEAMIQQFGTDKTASFCLL